MENSPLVSVVITTKGRKELLKRAVKSVHCQIYPHIELIVVDDGSNDGTEVWCEQQDFNYIRIDPISSSNANYARNRGLSVANGKYVAFLDDDDAWYPEKIIEQVDLAEKGYKVVYTLREFEVIEKNRCWNFKEKIHPNLIGDVSDKILTVECISSTSAILFNKQFLISIGAWDEQQEVWQDNELLIRCAQKTEFGCVNKCLTIYRIDNRDLKKATNSFFTWQKAAERMYNKHVNLYNRLGLLGKYKKLSIYIDSCAKRSWRANLKLLSLKYYVLSYCLNPSLLIKNSYCIFVKPLLHK